ncbi:antifreeze protein [Athelia psychrophila]|uniref:Antifreeze protein n=1 Tax=Athelia psychrophila TaxID=1759441 RepID=A0A166H816_9AGAM|nr:antifreeze protein [Fibularhizoctonia sp. CBS 109695]
MSSLAIAILFLSNSCLAAGPIAVHLGTAANYAIIGQAGISSVPNSVITGNIAVSPIAATAITGFGLTMSADGTYSTASQVKGKVYAADYASPTPARLTTAVLDMQTAYNNVTARANPDFSEVGAGVIGGHTFTPGFYKWTSTVSIDSSITIHGAAHDQFIFQIAGTLTSASGSNVILSGKVTAANIVWVVADAVTLGTNSKFEGTILGKTGITMQTSSNINGRLLAQTAVALQMATVTKPLVKKP